MSAQELRKAAETLRERAADAGPEDGPWDVFGTPAAITTQRDLSVGPDNCPSVADGMDGAYAHYIATMHPGVGLALARVLDEAANAMTHSDLCMDCFHPTCLTVGDLIPVAHLINGTEP